MSPAIFFQLTDASKLSVLYSEGVFVRERTFSPYLIQLFILDSNYYEVWQVSQTGQLIHISYIEEESALTLFPGDCEKEIAKKRKL